MAFVAGPAFHHGLHARRALLGRFDGDRHLMLMTARVGPARADFRGEVAMVACDTAGMRIDMDAHGADRRGTAATLRLTARIHPREPGHCGLIGRAVFHVHGTLAVLGASLLRRAGELDALLFVRRTLIPGLGRPVNRTAYHATSARYAPSSLGGLGHMS